MSAARSHASCPCASCVRVDERERWQSADRGGRGGSGGETLEASYSLVVCSSGFVNFLLSFDCLGDRDGVIEGIPWLADRVKKISIGSKELLLSLVFAIQP